MFADNRQSHRGCCGVFPQWLNINEPITYLIPQNIFVCFIAFCNFNNINRALLFINGENNSVITMSDAIKIGRAEYLFAAAGGMRFG